MARESRGIEVFGRGATIVESGGGGAPSRWLGTTALLSSLVALGLFVAAVRALLTGSDADVFGLSAFIASVIGAVLGFGALVSGRGRAVGFIALVVAACANPWVVHRLIDWAASLGSP
jgi:hypothetical protein